MEAKKLERDNMRNYLLNLDAGVLVAWLSIGALGAVARQTLDL